MRAESRLEPDHHGEYVFLDVATGDYEVDSDQLAAMARARAKHPDTVFYIVRVGYPAVGRIVTARVHAKPRLGASSPPSSAS